MLRKFLPVLVGMLVFIPLGAVIIYAPAFTGPFFEIFGGESYSALGGVAPADAVDFGTGLVFVALSALSIPIALALYFFMGGGDRRHPRSPRRPRY